MEGQIREEKGLHPDAQRKNGKHDMIVFSSADIQTSCESDRAADDPRSQGSRDLQRRLQVAKILYDQWTKVGSHVAGLAERSLHAQPFK